MTLRELLLSVDAEQYADSQLYQELLKVKPEYGSIDPELKISKIQLLDAILREMSTEGFNETDRSDFWTEMTNLQKAKIIR